ncbi:MAG: hypothetical protein KF724_05270 [Phycisphaeraceae bacterium]|nr:hypothetical protein [Phycisphaeraceae bacterium]
MALLTDAAYAVAALTTLPIWAVRMAMHGKLRTDWRARFGHAEPWPRQPDRRRLLVHAVSVGEVNAIRHLVAALERDPSAPELVISVTTDTGTARARALYADRHRVVRYPFDFSRSVRRFLDAVRPDVVALTELEVWPNFVTECRARGVPVAVINGRLSDRSEGRYRMIRPFVRSTFGALTLVAAQSEAYAARFRWMGTPAERVRVEGTMKWDTAEIADEVPGAAALAEALSIDRSRPLIVAGSTSPGEEALLLRSLPPGAQLLCAPRKPEWFEAAARALPGCVRRSERRGGRGASQGTNREAPHRPSNDLFLLDSIGELRQAYALADLVVIGRTFAVDRRYGGSDMIEPVALGKATVVGPDTSNFSETVTQLHEARGLVRCDAESLKATLAELLSNSAERAALAERGRAEIRARQGASERVARLLVDLLAGHRVSAPQKPPQHADASAACGDHAVQAAKP